MCGFTGVINFSKILGEDELSEVEQMLVDLRHREPDSEGIARAGRNGILGCCRLAITDATNRQADMPMRKDKNGLLLVFNGEIYNFEQLKAKLNNQKFTTGSDSEVILAAYEKWGTACLEHFEGMFAFCIYDRRDNTFFLAVDPAGQKPLFYLIERDVIIFSSEINPIIWNRRYCKSLNYQAIAEVVAHRFIIGEDTHIQEIKQLQPGYYLKISPDRITKKAYYKIPIGNQQRTNVEDISQEIRQVVHDACCDMFNFEVPVGLVLSGGIDSTAILAQAYRAGIDLKTYSIGFEKLIGQHLPGLTSTFDEFEYSRYAAKLYRTTHREISINSSEYLRCLDKWIRISGLPMAAPDSPCLVKLFEVIQPECKVIFCGSGPDEIFDGYKQGLAISQLEGCSSLNCTKEYYYYQLKWLYNVKIDRVLSNVDIADYLIQKYEDILVPYRDSVDNVIQLIQLMNYHGRCSAYEYRQMDITSMAHSVEVRSPFADTRVTCSAFNFNPMLKVKDGVEKWIWKKALQGVVPDQIAMRRKCGFPTPSEIWFTSEFEERVEAFLGSDSPIMSIDIFQSKQIRKMWNSKHPGYRSLFFRLYVINSVLTNQKEFLSHSRI
ncbi:MAG: asparagine synthase (glutamine-hydrolyzing) [Tolypothrix carrinoi HA7290-LM1]|jgi:asparagine synthase (glutamine-hydrolysing)|nr:asparagine synthase (glutamine-hydrolyzing) [Tolypothrix carrinoi HA7290-LM1]